MVEWDEAVEACSQRILQLSEQRPSNGFIARQRVSEDTIKYGQALLYATSQELLKLKGRP
jgi:hypothetical protein